MKKLGRMGMEGEGKGWERVGRIRLGKGEGVWGRGMQE